MNCAQVAEMKRCSELLGAILLLASTWQAHAECDPEQYFHPDDNFNRWPLVRPHREFRVTQARAKQGNPTEQRNLAVSYETGFLVTPCHAKTIYWYQRAAANGDAISQQWIRRKQEFDAIARRFPRNIVVGFWHGPGKLVCGSSGCSQYAVTTNPYPVGISGQSISANVALPSAISSPSIYTSNDSNNHGEMAVLDGNISSPPIYTSNNSKEHGGMVIGGNLSGTIWPGNEGGMIIGGPFNGSILPGSEGGMVIGGNLSGSFWPGSGGGMVIGGPLNGSIIPGDSGGMIIGGPYSGSIAPGR